MFQNFPNYQELKLKTIITFIIVLVALSIVYDGLVRVPAGYTAVIFDLGRGVLERPLSPGLHLKIPIWQKTVLFDVRTQQYTMSMAEEEGSLPGDDSVEARTKDGQLVNVDATILFHINSVDIPYVYQNLGTLNDAEVKIVRPQARKDIRSAVALYNALDLVSEKRDEFIQEINTRLEKSLSQHSITLEEAAIRNISFSEQFAAAIEEKQIAQEKVKTAEFRKEQSKQEKEQKIIEAEGEAQAISLKGAALKQYPEVIQLEFVNKMAQDIKWGILPDGVVPLLDLNKQ